MKAKQLIDEIFKNHYVIDENGEKVPLDSNIDKKEGEFLSKIIKENRPIKTIEIGCAYGISSLYICSELEAQENAHHTIIDPSQSTFWKNIGVANLRKAGIEFFELIQKPSEIALPELLSEGKKYDFGFIDGWHTFDHTLIDFFYLNRLIDVGGIIVIDDVSMPGIKKLMRYILKYPSYKQIGHVEVNISNKRKVFNATVKNLFKFISIFFPNKTKHEIFSEQIINLQKEKSLNSSMIALQKVEPDERPWNWFREF